VVYEEIDGERVYINDPLVGHTTISKDNNMTRRSQITEFINEDILWVGG
jgi:hypothetical protein